MRTRYDEKTLLQAKADYDDGMTLPVIAASLGMSYGNLHYIFEKRGWPLRAVGEKVNHRLKYFDAAPLLAELRKWNALSSNLKGTLAEHMAEVWLSQHGLDVWRPLQQHHCCDLGVLVGTRLVRCQVKVATYTKGHLYDVHFKCSSKRKYSDEHVDFFLVLCPGLPTPVFYVLPLTEMGRTDRARFYPHRQHFQLRKNWEQFKDAIHLIKGDNGSTHTPQT